MQISSINFNASHGAKIAGSNEILDKFEPPSQPKEYYEDKPNIYFIADYIVNDTYEGCILVFERYKKSTHYQIFKKNVISDTNPEYERILFVDRMSLEEESKHFISYIKDDLQMNNFAEDNCFIILDKNVKRDRIYQYAIKASVIPSNPSEIDYKGILFSKKMLDFFKSDDKNILLTVTAINGSMDIGTFWTISLLNKGINLFDVELISGSKKMKDITPNDIYFCKNKENIMLVLKDAFNLFGVKETYSGFIDALGGCNDLIKSSFLNAIEGNMFNYYKFMTNFTTEFPTFASFGLENNLNSSLMDYEGITKVVKFLIDTFYKYVKGEEPPGIIGTAIAGANTQQTPNSLIIPGTSVSIPFSPPK